MARTHRYVQRHRPLITPRIEFTLAARPQLPTVTPRIDFGHQDFSSSDLTTTPKQPRKDALPPVDPMVGRHPRSQAREGIPKPPGEPGRPNSGGFTLEDELKKHGWTENDITAFTLQVRETAQEKLDMSCSFRSQDGDLVKQICEKLSGPDYWPVLVNYHNCWPVRSALKLALKYSAEASRRIETKKVAIRVRHALRNTADED